MLKKYSLPAAQIILFIPATILLAVACLIYSLIVFSFWTICFPFTKLFHPANPATYYCNPKFGNSRLAKMLSVYLP